MMHIQHRPSLSLDAYHETHQIQQPHCLFYNDNGFYECNDEVLIKAETHQLKVKSFAQNAALGRCSFVSFGLFHEYLQSFLT